MRRRRPTLFARATQALAPLDGPVNVLNDLTVRFFRWTWWPAPAPRRDRPWGARQHAAYVGWSAAGFAVGEVLISKAPEELRSTGEKLRTERIRSGLLALVLWVVAVGAWDRRAAKLRRRPW